MSGRLRQAGSGVHAFCRFLPVAALLSTAAAAQVGDVPPGLDGSNRAGMPAVLVAPPQPPGRGVVAGDAFRMAYARAGAPRIILFWNRALSAEVSNSHIDWQATTASTRSAAATATDGWEASGAAVRESRMVTMGGAQRIDDGARVGLAEDEDWELEDAFQTAFMDAGARFVDRAAAIRATTVGQMPGERSDQQAVEAAALAGKADLLMEVLQTPAPGTPTGYRFRINVKDVRSAAIIATIVGDGTAIADRPARMVAVAGGFTRERMPAPGSRGAGRALAINAMETLSTRLR